MISINEHKWFSDCFENSEVTALKKAGKEFTYSEIKDKILSVSEYYLSQGIQANQNIPVLFTNQYKFIVSVYALWNIGAVPVLINNKLNSKEVCNQVVFIESTTIITDSNEIRFDTPNLKEIIFNEGKKTTKTDLRNLQLVETALMLFTSGSSGMPKCVRLSFKNLITSVSISDNQFSYLQNSTWIASLPFYHVGGFMIFFRALLTRSTVFLLQDFNELENLIKTEKPEYISLVPTQLKKMFDDGINFNRNLKNIFLGGGPIDDNLLNKILVSDLPVTPVYGSTETCSMISYQTIDELKAEKKISLLPFNEVEIKILKEGENDKVGEIAIKSDTLFSEYYKNKEETDSRFDRDFYLTNDLGYFDNNRLNIVGRKDDIILSGGENISAREIEKEILKIEGIEKVVVIGMNHSKWGKAVAALVETVLDSNKIETLLKDKLPSYKVPKVIKTIKKIPCTEIGKLNRNKVEQILTSNAFK